MKKHKAISTRKAHKDFLRGEEELHEVMERKLHGSEKKAPAKKHHHKEEKHKDKHDPKKKKDPKTPAKMPIIMKEFKEGKLHSGSKKGPLVTNPKQAVAIAYSYQKKARKKK